MHEPSVHAQDLGVTAPEGVLVLRRVHGGMDGDRAGKAPWQEGGHHPKEGAEEVEEREGIQMGMKCMATKNLPP